jgi:hypothetical protein
VKLLGVGLPPDLPDARARIPGVAIRATFVIACALLSLDVYGLNGWLVVAIVLSVAAVLAPQYFLGWGIILFLAAGQLAHRAALSWRFMVLLAGLHVLHILAMWVLELPWRSWVQPGVFVAPLLRFIVIQIPIQLLAVLSLLLLAPHSNGRRPLTVTGFAIVGAFALVCLALRLTGPIRDKD